MFLKLNFNRKNKLISILFKQAVAFIVALLVFTLSYGQRLTPPMGWMSWNLHEVNINEQVIKEAADYLVQTGLAKAGFNYVCIDDGWQGGRDNRNNLIADKVKFPNGIKAVADYVHAKGLKLGIYSDAAQITCGGFTASFGFEIQDANTFAAWEIDYLKYDYCNAPVDEVTAKERYTVMSKALKGTGREILFAVCEWGQRQPWLWAAKAGGSVWRTTWDIRDVWQSTQYTDTYNGLFNIYDKNVELDKYCSPGHFNDPDMLVVGLYGKGKASSITEESNKGCTDIEYRSNMSLWCMMAAPLMISCDLKNMSPASKEILLNEEVIAINQDSLCIQAKRVVKKDGYDILLKPLANGDCAVAILNKLDTPQKISIQFSDIGLTEKYTIKNVWTHQVEKRSRSSWSGIVLQHETIVLRLNK